MNWPPPDETRIEGAWPGEEAPPDQHLDEHPQEMPHWEPEPQKEAPPKQPSFTDSGTWSAQGRKGMSLQLPSLKRSRPVKPPRPVGAPAPAKASRSFFKLPSFKRSRAEGAPPADASGAAKPSPRSSLLSNKAAIAIALVVVLLAAAALYHFTRSGGSSTPTGPSPSGRPAAALVLSLNKGQSTQYRMNMSFQATASVGGTSVPVHQSLATTMDWRVVSVDRNGVASVELRTSKGKVTVNGKTASQPPLTMHIRMARDGRILTGATLGTTTGATGGSGLPGMDQFAPLLPDHPVRPGDSWTKSFDQAFPYGSGRLHYTATNHFVRYETVGGTRAAVVTSTMTIPVNLSFNLRELARAIGTKGSLAPGRNPSMSFAGTVAVNMTAWLDLAQRSLLKTLTTGHFHLAMRFVGFPSGAMPPGGRLGLEGTMTLNMTNVRLVGS